MRDVVSPEGSRGTLGRTSSAIVCVTTTSKTQGLQNSPQQSVLSHTRLDWEIEHLRRYGTLSVAETMEKLGGKARSGLVVDVSGVNKRGKKIGRAHV